MTSQLILANGDGVALASDSALTFREHVYETNQKIVPLSEPHQLAVVSAGLGNFYRLPIEVVVRQWDRSLGDERLPSVEGYRDRFLSWLAHSLDELASPEELDRRALAFFCRDGYLKEVSGQVEQMLKQAEWSERIPDEELPGLIEARVLGFLREQNQEAKKAPRSHVTSAAGGSFSGVPWELIEGTFEKLWLGVGDDGPGLRSAIEEAFHRVPLSEEIEQEIHIGIYNAIEKYRTFPLGGAIVLSFAGYGSDDLLPEISSVNLGGALEDHIWFRDIPCTHSRDEEHFCRIHSQAYGDQIIQFLTGLGLPGQAGWEVLERAADQVRAAWDKLDYSQRTSERLSAAFDEVAGSLIDKATEQGNRNLRRVVLALANMPLAELANTARQLVGLEVLDQIVRAEQLTVGGPIVVATITLHEGFQWETPNEPAT